MTWRNTSSGYGLVQILLHWSSAVMIAVLVPLGLWMTGLDYYDPWYKKGPDLHRALGVLFGILLVLRLVARTAQVRPQVRARSGWERRTAAAAHFALYALPVLLVASGYLISTADGRSVDVFGWFEVPAMLHGIEGQADIAGEIHFWLAMALLAVIALHVAAALRHHLVDRDDTLLRMLRPPRATGEAP